MKNFKTITRRNIKEIADEFRKVLLGVKTVSATGTFKIKFSKPRDIKTKSKQKAKERGERGVAMKEHASLRLMRYHNKPYYHHISFAYNFGPGRDGAFGFQIKKGDKIKISNSQVDIIKIYGKGKGTISHIHLFR
jgi:hypothetical protein